MKTLNKLSSRALNQLQARIMGGIWLNKYPKLRAKIMVRIAEERMKRIEKDLP